LDSRKDNLLAAGAIDAAVDMKPGTISRDIFCDESIFEIEFPRIFERSWLFVGHTSQLAKPGDFFLSKMGRESVIVVRDRAGDIQVILNSCRHRGMPVCRYDQGNTAAFTCTYHGWTYATDGQLQGVPRYETAYAGSLDKAQWGLIRARVEVFYGSIWATFNQAAPSLGEYLGGMASTFGICCRARMAKMTAGKSSKAS